MREISNVCYLNVLLIVGVLYLSKWFFFYKASFSTSLPSQAGTTKLQINVKKLKKSTKVFYLFDLIKDGRLT